MSGTRRFDLVLAFAVLAALCGSFVASGSSWAIALSIVVTSLAPGRAVLRHVAPALRGSLSFALALATSPVIAGVFVTLAMLIGASCRIAAIAMLVAAAGSLVYTALRTELQDAEDDAPRLGLPAIALALLATALVVWPLATSNRVRTSIHGMLHSAILFGALEGGVPPTNPFFAGEPLRYYWTWHLAVAAPVELSGADPTIVFAAGNGAACLVFALLLGHLALYLGTRYLGAKGPRVAALGVLLGLVSLNPLGAYVFSQQADELGAKFSPLASLASGDDVIRYIQALALGKDDRITATLTKFFNVSSFPIALALLAAAWLFTARTIDRPNRSNVVITILVVGGGIALSPLSGLTGGLAIGVAGGIALLVARADPDARRNVFLTLLTLLLAVAAATPFVLFSGGDDSGSVRFLATAGKLREHLLAIAPAALLALPSLLLAARRDRAGTMLALAGLALLPLGICLNFPVNSEYKMVREAAPLLGVFAAVTLEWMFARRRLATSLGACALLIFFLPTNVIAWNAYRFSARAELPFRFANGTFELDATTHPIEEVYAWIRANTEANAALLDDQEVVRHFAGPFHGAEAPALAQRAVFCDMLGYMNDYEPDFRARFSAQQALYSGRGLSPEEVRRFDGIGVPLYAIVRNDSPRVNDSLRGFLVLRRFERVFECSAGKVYRWKNR